MARKRSRTRRSKTISKQSLVGQRGVNLIERVVLEMGSHWTPTGQGEVGIDGYIEFFDPTTGKPLHVSVAAQSKVYTNLTKETGPTFDYSCNGADLDYWLAHSMPVILVVSSPSTDEAYWVSIKDYFASGRKSNRITFNKAEQAFTRESLPRLVSFAAPKSGIYLAPAKKPEKLHSNLLTLAGHPEQISFGETECRSARDVWAILRHEGGDVGGSWVFWENKIVSFYDLSRGPWRSVCDGGVVESFAASDWSESEDPDRQRLFVQLLNRTLPDQLWPEVRYWPREDCYAMVGGAKKLAYASLKRSSTISVVSHFKKAGADGKEFEWTRHMAFRGQFRRVEGQWFLEITPTYRFTRNGHELHRFHEEGLKGIKRLEGNRAVLSSVLFWADYLRPKPAGLFDSERTPLLTFGDLLTFDAPVGITDKDWLAADPEYSRRSEGEARLFPLEAEEDS